MILVLAIILFIIFLIYSIRPSKSEEYTLEGLKLSWANKASIEGVVTKWIVTLKDSSGSVIHTYENSDAGNLKDFTDVTMNIVDKKEFDEKIIGDNTLELYYNDIKPDTKLYTKTVTFTRDDFGMSLDTSNLEEIDIPEPETFTYELIMNKKNSYLGIHIEYIKLDGVLATKAQTTIHKNPNRNNKPDNMFSIGSGTTNYAAWNANGHNEGDKIFTIVSDKKVDKIDIVYTRPRYAPGWIIKENGVTKITETSNRGGNTEPRPVVYTYDIKNGKSTIFSIPHQIPPGNADGWCNHANAVHQDVPGCGRICSDPSNAGRKSKNTFVPWNKYPGSVECTEAKLDEVYQFLNGKRSLRVGKVSESGAMDLTGGFKWYYYKGSYFSGVNSFSGKNPTNQGENVTDFSSKHKATGGHLRNDGNEDNYAVKWEGFFAPKKTGSHKFWTESDDMSYLYVNNTTVVNNGGLHGMVKKNGSINLTAGEKYPIKIYFSEKGGGDELKVWFQGPDISSAIHDFSGYMVK
jgi:fibro-slime domain-containing protein